jgi:hypothetical protein
MPGPPARLLQTAADADTTLLVALLLIALGLGYLVMRAAADKITGAFDEDAAYVLVRDPDDGLAIAAAGDDRPRAPLDGEAMRALADRVHGANELRLHTVVVDGRRLAFEDWDPSEDPAPSRLVVEASRGRVDLRASGHIDTNPPLDDAVRRDLVDLLDDVLADPARSASAAEPS